MFEFDVELLLLLDLLLLLLLLFKLSDVVVGNTLTIDDVGNTDELAPFNTSLLLLHDILINVIMEILAKKKIERKKKKKFH